MTGTNDTRWWFEHFEGVDARDMDRWFAGLSDDVVVRFSNWPVIRGKAALKSHVIEFNKLFVTISHKHGQLFTDGNLAAGEGVVTFTMHDGREISIPGTTVMEHRDGLIRRIAAYLDFGPLFAPAADNVTVSEPSTFMPRASSAVIRPIVNGRSGNMQWWDEYYRAVDGGQIEKFSTWYADDIVSRFGNMPVTRSKRALVDSLTQFFQQFVRLDHVWGAILYNGDLAVGEGVCSYTLHDGRKIWIPVVTVIERRKDGLICRSSVYFDAAPLFTQDNEAAHVPDAFMFAQAPGGTALRAGA